MEIHVWVNDTPKAVANLTQQTTCQQVIVALAQTLQRVGRYTLSIRSYPTSYHGQLNVDRQLKPSEKIYDVVLWLQKLDCGGDIRFVLEHTLPSSSDNFHQPNNGTNYHSLSRGPMTNSYSNAQSMFRDSPSEDSSSGHHHPYISKIDGNTSSTISSLHDLIRNQEMQFDLIRQKIDAIDKEEVKLSKFLCSPPKYEAVDMEEITELVKLLSSQKTTEKLIKAEIKRCQTELASLENELQQASTEAATVSTETTKITEELDRKEREESASLTQQLTVLNSEIEGESKALKVIDVQLLEMEKILKHKKEELKEKSPDESLSAAASFQSDPVWV